MKPIQPELNILKQIFVNMEAGEEVKWEIQKLLQKLWGGQGLEEEMKQEMSELRKGGGGERQN